MFPRSAGPPLLAVLLVASASACRGLVERDELPIELAESFSPSGTTAVPDRWWTAFDDRDLDRLVDDALRSNLDLEATWQRLRQARAIVDREASLRAVELDAEVDAALRRPEPPDGDTLRIGLGAFYEVDLWGRVDARADAAALRAHASLLDYRTAALTLSAEVVLAALRTVEAREQAALLTEQLATNRTVLQLIEARYGTGLVRRVDVLRQRQLVEATRSQRLEAEARVAVLEHLLAVLLGRSPQDGATVERTALPPLPPLPDTGVPADLVRRRPDVQRAQTRLAAADRDLAAAIAERYPRLTLTASLSTADDGADVLFDDWLRSLAANLLVPLIDGGRRRAEVERGEAVVEELLAGYGQATLLAFREVEDALVLERVQLERIASLEAQLALADRALEQLRSEYLNGVGDYLEVLTALDGQQRLRRDLLAERLTALEYRVALYRALAGGFDTERELES